jgi:soluble lytic murein transglycosylase-like protein
MILWLIVGINSPALADVYGLSGEDGTILLTDNDEGRHYQLLATEPVIQELSTIQVNKSNVAPDEVTFKHLNYTAFKDEIRHAAQENQIDMDLIHAIILVESNYNPRAKSSKGAVGLMQLMPSTAKRFGVEDIYDPSQNIHGGARYLAYLLKLFNNDKKLAVAAYNSGEQSVIKYGLKIPPFRETTNYVSKVASLILI